MNDIKNLPNASWVTPPSKNEKILRRAIETAIANGWKHFSFKDNSQYLLDEIADTDMHKCLGNASYSVIYNHDFARALWGEGINWTENDDGTQFIWQYHLQTMVISDDPIAYLGSTLTKGVE